jgi:cbb3-type cytochrome oxidase subunit 3
MNIFIYLYIYLCTYIYVYHVYKKGDKAKKAEYIVILKSYIVILYFI